MKFDGLCRLPAFGINSALSCRSVRARAIARSHGWRRLVTGRLVDRGTRRLSCEFATGGVELEPLHVRRHYLSNHRVEVNRHQPPRLAGRPGDLMAWLHSNLLGQVAVTHSGRWTHVHESGGLFSMTASLKSDASRNLMALGIAAHFGYRGVRSRAIAKSRGWRRLVTSRSVDCGTTRLTGSSPPAELSLSHYASGGTNRPTIESR